MCPVDLVHVSLFENFPKDGDIAFEGGGFQGAKREAHELGQLGLVSIAVHVAVFTSEDSSSVLKEPLVKYLCSKLSRQFKPMVEASISRMAF